MNSGNTTACYLFLGVSGLFEHFAAECTDFYNNCSSLTSGSRKLATLTGKHGQFTDIDHVSKTEHRRSCLLATVVEEKHRTNVSGGHSGFPRPSRYNGGAYTGHHQARRHRPGGGDHRGDKTP